MKKTTLILSTFIVCINAFSQNVGVGTATPSQKLDVAGNINTTGNLMINGAAGTNGQVLTMNGSTMQWMNKGRFGHYATYGIGGISSIFTVPAGITEVMIEMWGGGGGAHNPGGGGGSGGYFCGLIPVTGNSAITVVPGTGGLGGNYTMPAGFGSASRFVCIGFNMTAGGGEGGDSTHANANTIEYIGGQGAIPSNGVLPTGFKNYINLAGNNGAPTFQSVIAVSSTNYSLLWIGGIGAVAPFSGLSEDVTTYKYGNAGINISSRSHSSEYKFGCGGSVNFGFPFGNRGSDGLIIIYY
ncbi:MAG TPA: hypothetical protein VGO58_18120 [Chitinophagaceae bacterium]|jgi:hypothetical protein|nr:hypothetical protein [Chitinophagaceae bacterium]